MKTRYFLVLAVFSMAVLTLSGFKKATISNDDAKFIEQETIIEATYDGHESYGYNFISTHSDGEEFTVTFQKIDDAVAKEFDLDSETFIKTKFKITYKTKVVVTKDDDGYEEEEEINTIIKLEKL